MRILGNMIRDFKTHPLKKDLNEIEKHLDQETRKATCYFHRISTKKSEKEGKKSRVDAQWIGQTAYKKITLSLRKALKHM